MADGKYIVGRGTVILVAPLTDCDRIRPESTVLTVGATAAAEATSITVAFAPALTRTIKATANYPLYLNFIDPSGIDNLVVVTADIDPGDTTITVEPLKRAVASGATAQWPVLLRNRNTANLTANDNSVDVMTFATQGWRDSVTTMLGQSLECNGYYSPLDAGYNTCLKTRLTMSTLYWELRLPKPGCEINEVYTKGHIIYGFGGVQMPIETGADQVINSNISIQSRGIVTF